MKRQQLVWLFLSLSDCSMHMIPGMDWRNLLFFFSCLLSSISSLTSMVWVSTETRVVWGRAETGVVWTSTWAVWISVWVSTETKAVWISVWVSTVTKATLLRRGLWLSVCSAWSPGYGGKVGGQEGAQGFTPKSIPLRHKSGIFHREKKGNTYATSTHFPCSLQNWSNCKTVLYLRDPPTGHRSPSSNGYRGHAVSHKKTRCVFF